MSPGPRLRVSGGARRGLKLTAPATIRPTAGRLREALFDIWGPRLPGCTLLDLFAGSGAVGIEAASRGARSVVLVEQDGAALSHIERNLRAADLPTVRLVRAKLPQGLAAALGADARFDLVFADPPYGWPAEQELLALCLARLNDGGEVALERDWLPAGPTPPPGLRLRSHRRYGGSGLSIYRAAAAAVEPG